MLRHLALIAVPALALLAAPTADAQRLRPARVAQWRAPLVGNYENVSSGGFASVHQLGRGYLFINEHGAEAEFAYTGPNRLEMVRGEWAPTRVTVGRDRGGRVLLRFDSTGRPGYWLQLD